MSFDMIVFLVYVTFCVGLLLSDDEYPSIKGRS